MESKININREHWNKMTLINARARGQCYNRRRVSNKRRLSFRHRCFEVRVLYNKCWRRLLEVLLYWYNSGIEYYLYFLL